jgi:hypothetical protein
MKTVASFGQGNRYSSRRGFFRQLSFTAALFSLPGLFAEELTRKTPRMEEGPFYPPKLPLETLCGVPHKVSYVERSFMLS